MIRLPRHFLRADEPIIQQRQHRLILTFPFIHPTDRQIFSGSMQIVAISCSSSFLCLINARIMLAHTCCSRAYGSDSSALPTSTNAAIVSSTISCITPL